MHKLISEYSDSKLAGREYTIDLTALNLFG